MTAPHDLSGEHDGVSHVETESDDLSSVVDNCAVGGRGYITRMEAR